MFKEPRKFIADLNLFCGDEEGPPREVTFKLRPSGWRQFVLGEKKIPSRRNGTAHPRAWRHVLEWCESWEVLSGGMERRSWATDRNNRLLLEASWEPMASASEGTKRSVLIEEYLRMENWQDLVVEGMYKVREKWFQAFGHSTKITFKKNNNKTRNL